MNAKAHAFYLAQSGLGMPDRDYYTRDDNDARKLRHLQATLYTLADAWERNVVPEVLRELRTKAQVESLLGGYYPSGWVTTEVVRRALAAISGKPGVVAIRPVIEGILRRSDSERSVTPVYGMGEVQVLETLQKLAGTAWTLPAATLKTIESAWEQQFDLLFERLAIGGTQAEVDRFVRPVAVKVPLSEYLRQAGVDEDVKDLAD